MYSYPPPVANSFHLSDFNDLSHSGGMLNAEGHKEMSSILADQ